VTSTEFKFGVVCRLKSDQSVSWKIVAFPADRVGSAQLTGPGPCRSLQSVSIDVLEKDWEIVVV